MFYRDTTRTVEMLYRKYMISEILVAAKQDVRPFMFAHKDLQLFARAYIDLNKKLDEDKLNINSPAGKILAQCEELFVANKESTKTLTAVLVKTLDVINNPGDVEKVQNYRDFTKKISKTPSYGMQALGKLMMRLAQVMTVVIVAMVAMGVGLLPAVGVSAASLGLFAAGALVNKRAIQDNRDLTNVMESFLPESAPFSNPTV